MNTLKNVLFFGLLLAVLCGVYLSLNRTPEPTLPPGLSGDTRYPKVDLGQMGSPLTNITSGTASTSPPDFPSQPPPVPTPPANPGGIAPPFSPPGQAGPSSIAPPFPSRADAMALPAPPPAVPSPPVNYLPRGANTPDPKDTLGPPPVDPSVVVLPPPPDHASPTRLEPIMQQVNLLVGENKLADALLILSQLYGNPDLPATQARRVTEILDQMAGKVIYSREHLLENPYLVQAGDTLDAIADRYHVPALLLTKINGLRDPQTLPPGKELKVLKGPFSAQISTDHSEMTLMLDGRYAGRFSVLLSNDLNHATGMYTVRKKDVQESAAGKDMGKHWIGLGNASGDIFLYMQGTNDSRVTSGRDSRNTIWLSEQDMDDVFGILSVTSRVIVQR